MKIRSLKEAERPSITGLLAAALDRDWLNPGLVSEKLWADEGVTDALRLGVEVDGRLVGVGCGAIRHRDGEELGFIKLLAVDVQFRREGLASRLLGALEAALATAGCQRIRLGESAPNYLWPGVDLGYTAALLLFEKHGYQQFGETFNMSVDLLQAPLEMDAAVDILAGANLTVRRACASDHPSLMRLLAEHWPSWQAECQYCFEREPISLHVAVQDDAVVAFAAHDANNRGLGWFGPMGTAPQVRGKGLGAVLLKRCLRDMRDAGRRQAVIPWVGPLAFYAHHAGARIQRVFHRFEKRL